MSSPDTSKPPQKHVLVTFGREVTAEDLAALQAASADAAIDGIDMDIHSPDTDIDIHTLR